MKPAVSIKNGALLAVLPAIFLMACSSDRYVSDPTGLRIRNHSAIHLEILFLPEKNKTYASLLADTLIVRRTDSADSTIQKVLYMTTPADKPLLDSLIFFADRLRPGTYAKKGVLEGTKLWITYKDGATVCDNCLADYVLRQSGLKLARPPRNVAVIKTVVGLMNELIGRAPKTGERQWKRLEVVTDVSRLTDTTMKYRVKNLDTNNTVGAGRGQAAPKTQLRR